MKKILSLLTSLFLVPTFSFVTQGCNQINNNVKYDTVKDAIDSLKTKIFNVNITDIQKFSFCNEDYIRTKITNFNNDVYTDKLWRIMVSNINNYMMKSLKKPIDWAQYLPDTISNYYSWTEIITGDTLEFKVKFANNSNPRNEYFCDTKFKFNFESAKNAVGFYLNYFLDHKSEISNLDFVGGYTYNGALNLLKTYNFISVISNDINYMTDYKFNINLEKIAKIEYIYNNIKYNSIYDAFSTIGEAGFHAGSYNFSLIFSFYHNEVLSDQVKNESLVLGIQ